MIKFIWGLPEDIPREEEWLFLNSAAITSVLTGIEQAERGEGKFMGSFSEFDEDENSPS